MAKMEDFLQKFFDKTLEWVVIAGMLFLVTLGFFNVFFRYALGSSALYWADELLRYSVIVLVFMGSVLGVSRKLHVKIDVVQKMLPPKLCYWLTLLGYLSMLIFCLIMVKHGHLFAQTGLKMFSASMGLKMYYLYMVIPVSFALMAINTLRVIIREYLLKGYACTTSLDERSI